MAVGFETYQDTAGATVRHSATGRIAKVLGMRLDVSTSGSLTDSRLTQGSPFVICSVQQDSLFGNGCDWSVSGSTLSWDFQNSSGEVLPTTIIYGIY